MDLHSKLDGIYDVLAFSSSDHATVLGGLVVNLDSKLTPINLDVWSNGKWQPITKTIASNNSNLKQNHDQTEE